PLVLLRRPQRRSAVYLPLRVARDVRPQHFGTRHSSAFVSVALAAFTRFTRQRQLFHGANGDSRPNPDADASDRRAAELPFARLRGADASSTPSPKLGHAVPLGR